jgi:AAA+ ATPase superfamily predicted ATPase
VVGTDFYNRENLIQDILVGPADGLWIIGNRRIGKTSLLRTAEYKTANTQYLPLFWDMQGDTSETQLVESLLEAVENALGSEIDQRWRNKALSFEGTVSNISQALRRLSTFARQQDCRLLLLCDEIEGLNLLGQQAPHVLSQLRRSMQQNPNIRTVLASTRRLSRLYAIQQNQDTSLFLEGFEPRYLTNFNQEVAKQVICRTQSNHPCEVDERTVSKICFFSGNHPLILQKVCSQLYDHNVSSLRYFDENEFILDDQLYGTFQQDFDSLTPDEANILLYINNQALSLEEIKQIFPHISAHSLRRILHDLTQLGFLRRLDGAYQAGNIPLGQWLTTNPTHHSTQGGVTNRVLREVAQERYANFCKLQIFFC